VDFISEALSGEYGKITEKMFFPHRSRKAIVRNI
jgi:hypothetical protein